MQLLLKKKETYNILSDVMIMREDCIISVLHKTYSISKRETFKHQQKK